MTDNFEEFYTLYANKRGRTKAQAAYNKAIKKVSHEEIIRGVTAYRAWIEATGTERQFVKMPATWLNGECWDDDYTIERKRTVHDNITSGIATKIGGFSPQDIY